jgi:membrane-bound lytic murein transglycosylase D
MADILRRLDKEGLMPDQLRAITRYAACVLAGAAVTLVAITALATDSVGQARAALVAATWAPELPMPFVPQASDDAAITWDISNLAHARVEYWIVRFQTDMREDFGRFLERKGRYQGLITAALDERGMPRDLVYLAMIESGFNPRAHSKARAAGLWQFIRETGTRYGLDVNSAVDERNCPVKSTQAALAYLSDLHERFGSWYLAAAAYNTGENRVGRIMRRHRGTERGTDADYYAIWEHLPRETRDYVPLMIAAARISKQPELYGFEYVKPHEPWSFEEVLVGPGTSLVTVAREAGTTVQDLKLLNPHLKQIRTRRDEPTTLRIPPTLEATRDAALTPDRVRAAS